MERSTISQAMLRVSELERIYRDKMYTMMRLENIVQDMIVMRLSTLIENLSL